MSTTVKKGLATGHQPSGKTPSAPAGHLPRQDGGGTKSGAGKERKRDRKRRSTKNKGAGFVPSKGGDGGSPVKVRRGPNWSANARLVLTGASIRCKADRTAFELLLVETTDACDRAHNEKKLIHPKAPPTIDNSWELCLLGEIDLPGSTPRSRARRYHPSQMVGRPGAQVGIDSMFDHAARIAAMFERVGIEMGWHTRFPRERSERVESERVQLMSAHFAGMTRDQVRNRVQQKTSMGMTREERNAQRQGTAMLRAHLVDWDGMDDE